MNPIITIKALEFIPTKESRLLIAFFYRYTGFLLKLRFRSVNVRQDYKPSKESKTVYFLNHNYWWDGLLPLYLNEKYFGQKARALMEDVQMRRYPFFSKIGAFSINLKNPKSSIKSLRYALESMNREKACLFLYPEGEIVPVSEKTAEFKNGLAWLYQKSETFDFVPIGIYIDHSLGSKPDLNIYIGKSVNPDKSLGRNVLTKLFKEYVDEVLAKSRTMTHQVHS